VARGFYRIYSRINGNVSLRLTQGADLAIVFGQDESAAALQNTTIRTFNNTDLSPLRGTTDPGATYQTLQSDSENLGASARLETVANQAWDSAQRRYQSGIGTILELITTQTNLAQARQERVEALTTWRYDRPALGAALGRLGPSDL
jgi:hypothetical protein